MTISHMIKTIGLFLVLGLTVSAQAATDFGQVNEMLRNALLKRDIDWLARHLDHKITDKAGISLYDLIPKEWNITSYKTLATAVDNLGPQQGEVVTVVAEIGSPIKEVVVIYWHWVHDQWILLNFPFGETNVPNEFPFDIPK